MIEKTHHAMSDSNIELLNYVAEHTTCTWADLFKMFSGGPETDTNVYRSFSKKLERLLTNEQLQCTGAGKNRVFTLGALAGKQKPARGRVNDKAGQAVGSDVVPEAQPEYVQTFSEGRVPPRQYDVMHGSFTYTLAAPVRPGAMDHTNYNTYGLRC